jgi:hypothetical protein
MGIEDILAEFHLLNPDSTPAERFQAELLRRPSGGPAGLATCARRVLAAALLRLSLWLDRAAADRLKPAVR